MSLLPIDKCTLDNSIEAPDSDILTLLKPFWRMKYIIYIKKRMQIYKPSDFIEVDIIIDFI